jgi:Zn-dependent protease with chaperone function
MIFHNWQIVAVLAWLVTLLLYVYEGWSIGLRLVAGFRVASSRLSELVRAVSERASLPSPKVFEFDSVFPNAWAMPSRGMLLFSSALSETLDSEEQKAIIAHELAHLSETKAQIVGRLLPSFVGVPIAIGLYTLGAIVFRPLDFIDSIFLFCLTAFWVIFVIAILYHRFSERLEIAADKKAVLSEDSKGSYARALERIYEASLIPAILPKRRKTHPDLYDRLLASGISPSFSRPALPPKRELRIAATCSAIVCAWLFSIAIFAASRLVGLPRWEHLSRPVVERDER